jgi:hypothetical protein
LMYGMGSIQIFTLYEACIFLWSIDPIPGYWFPLRCLVYTLFGHTTLGGTRLDDWSAGRRDLYLTTHKAHKDRHPCPGVIRNRNPSNRETADPHLRPRAQWDVL